MDLLVTRLRSNQFKFPFVAAKPQDKNYLLYHCKGGGMFGYPLSLYCSLVSSLFL